MAVSVSWQALRDELRRWQDAGRSATFWWRDDDAENDSPQLDRLLRLAEGLEVTLALAVIPRDAGEDLAQRLRAAPAIDVLQHGYAHSNHAPTPDKKSELGAHRAPDAVMAELIAGRERLLQRFDTFQAVLVPPWNRIDHALLPHVAAHGFTGVSTSTPRTAAVDAYGLRHVNTHVDPIAWQNDRAFCGEETALRQALRHLSARLAGTVDSAEPTGLLTHHRVQDEAVWAFCERLIDETRAFSNVRWLSARELFSTQDQ